MSILVDTSIWIDYFDRTGGPSEAVDRLIEENLVATNPLILAELTPPLHVRGQKHLISLLKTIKQYPITVNWDDIVQMQVLCLNKGIDRVGIPDLIIAQNAIQLGISLLSADKHFTLMAQHLPLALHPT